MAAVDAAGSAVVDVADAETYLGDDASDHGHHAEHGQADEPEAAAMLAGMRQVVQSMLQPGQMNFATPSRRWCNRAAPTNQ